MLLMNDTIRVTKVVVDRAEGLIEECGKRTFNTLAEAEAFLKVAARTAPATGGYNKCDFVVSFSDDTSYEGRVDLQRQHSTEGYSIAQHVEDFLMFYAGRRKPAHMTAKNYADFLKSNDSRVGAPKSSEYEQYWEKYGAALKGPPAPTQNDFLAWAGV